MKPQQLIMQAIQGKTLSLDLIERALAHYWGYLEEAPDEVLKEESMGDHEELRQFWAKENIEPIYDNEGILRGYMNING